MQAAALPAPALAERLRAEARGSAASDLEDGEEPPQFSGDAKAVNRGAAQSSRLSDDFWWI